VVLFDRLAKIAIVNFFKAGESLPVFPPVFHLTYVQNTGAAFGLFKGYVWVFLVVSVLVSIWLLIEIYSKEKRDFIYECSIALILGGAVGNLIDRATLGFVIDFLDFRVWPVFNVADSCITIGVTFILWHSFKNRKLIN
jgi:signal peptidase II